MRPTRHFSRRHRFRLVVVMLLCFLFQQVAMAAYVCTVPTVPVQAAMTTDDCAAMGMTASGTMVGHRTVDARCADHCAGNASSTTDARLPTVPALLSSTIFTLALVDTVQACHDSDVPDRTMLRPEPPPTLRFCSLLI